MIAETGTSLTAVGAGIGTVLLGVIGALGVRHQHRKRNGHSNALCAVHTATLERHSEKIGALGVQVSELDKKLDVQHHDVEEAIQGQTKHIDAQFYRLRSERKAD